MPALSRDVVTLPARRGWKWAVAALWIVLFAVLGTLSAKLGEVQDNDTAAWLPPSAESTRAFDIATEQFGVDDGAVDLYVVYARDGGLTEADTATAQHDGEQLAAQLVDGQFQVVPSPDGEALLLTGRLTIDGQDLDAFSEAVSEIRDLVHDDVPDGLAVAVTGEAGSGGDFADAMGGFDSKLLLAALGIVAVLLIVTYRSPVLWIFPLLGAFFASQIAGGIIYLLADADILTVNGQSAAILPVLTIGVGTDYALLLVARYREELHVYADRHAAMAKAVRRTIPAVLASAATVALAMLVLLVSDLASNASLGPVLAIGVAVVFLAMMTLLPAILVCLGRWVFWPYVPRHDDVPDVDQRHAVWSPVAKFVVRRARPLWMATAVLLLAATGGITQLTSDPQPNGGFTKEVESVQGLELLAQHFTAGATDPVDVYVRPDAVEPAVAALRGVSYAAEIAEPVVVGEWAHVAVVLDVPPTSTAADDAVDAIRAAVHAVPGADAAVGGMPAVSLDIDRAATRDQNVVIPLTLLLIVVILALLLRALVAPLLLLASVVLSFFAALGVSGLLLTVMGYPEMTAGFVLFVFIFLVALGVDYTIFLTTRAREEVVRLGDHTAGFQKALTVTGGVITSAGLVLAGTFSMLAIMPVITLMQMGLIVALGILIDTFVVRSMLLPALAVHVGRRFWAPSRLARLQPPAVPSQPSAPDVPEPAPTA